MHTEEFEPVYITVEGPMLPTESGKRWLDGKFKWISKFWDVLKDLEHEAKMLMGEWDTKLANLADAGLPLMASGFSQYVAPKILDYCDGLTTTAFNPASQQLALTPATPTYSSTGVTIADGTSNYTGYARQATAPATYYNAATTGGAPSQITSKAQIQWAGCSGGSAITENGVGYADNASTNTGNLYFWATITAVTISPTQTPPTIASGALTISLNTT